MKNIIISLFTLLSAGVSFSAETHTFTLSETVQNCNEVIEFLKNQSYGQVKIEASCESIAEFPQLNTLKVVMTSDQKLPSSMISRLTGEPKKTMSEFEVSTYGMNLESRLNESTLISDDSSNQYRIQAMIEESDFARRYQMKIDFVQVR